MPHGKPQLKQFVLGVDYSIRSPSISIFDKSNKELLSIIAVSGGKSKTPVIIDSSPLLILPYPSSWSSHEERAFKLAKTLLEGVMKTVPLNGHVTPIEMVFEGYAFSGKGRSFHLAEAAAFFKTAMISTYGLNHISFHTIQPSTAKKYATGKGTASKGKVTESFMRQNKKIVRVLCQAYGLKKHELLNKTPIDDMADSYFVGMAFMNQ